MDDHCEFHTELPSWPRIARFPFACRTSEKGAPPRPPLPLLHTVAPLEVLIMRFPLLSRVRDTGTGVCP